MGPSDLQKNVHFSKSPPVNLQGMKIQEPIMVRLNNSRNDTLAQELKRQINPGKKLAVAIFTAKQADRYRYGGIRFKQ